MRCYNPMRNKVTKGVRQFANEFPCGQCLACRITKRQQWTGRLLLEYLVSRYVYFVTLTYAPEYLPKDGSLVKADLQKYIKRLRKRWECNNGQKERTFRYYAVGEYGEKTFRPHYHILCFQNFEPVLQVDCRGVVCGGDFHDAWLGNSIVDVRLVPGDGDGQRVAQYVAGYVVKKWTNAAALDRVGRGDLQPEFSLMSRRPGIGLGQAAVLGEALLRSKVSRETLEEKDGREFHMVRISGKLWPIDRVLKEKIVSSLGDGIMTDSDMAYRRERNILRRALTMDPEERIKADMENANRAVNQYNQRHRSRKL